MAKTTAARAFFSQISQDAVQEFQVVSADFSAEYGSASGGVVNTITRSGDQSISMGQSTRFIETRI